LDENFARLITTFDEVPLLCARTKARMRLASHAHPSSARSKGVDLKRRPPKSRPTANPGLRTALQARRWLRERGPR
jgi:hypothetical protein